MRASDADRVAGAPSSVVVSWASVIPRRGERLLPVLSGVLLALSFPPLHLLIPPFVALVPFALWAARLPADHDGARSAARGGLLLGAVTHGLLLHWLVPALVWTTVWAPLAFLAVVAVLSALCTLFAWALHRGIHGAGAPIWLVLPVAWTAREWIQGHLPGPLAFPWLELSVALTGFPALLGMAELVGGRGVTFWMASVSGLVTWTAAGWRWQGRVWRVSASAGLAVVALAPGLWGVHRSGTLSTVPVARVAVIGTDLPAQARSDAEGWNATVDSTLTEAIEVLDRTSFDLLVLPEGAVMASVTSGSDAAILARLGDVAASRGTAVLLGVYGAGDVSANLAVLLQPDGAVSAPYRKRRLVPLVEWLPGDPPVDPSAPAVLAAASAGAAPTTVGYGPLICFEAVFPDAARRARLAGADILVNVSNDAWFSASDGLGNVGRLQHAAHLVVRAVEHRMGAVRSANGGPSFGVDPVGRVQVVASGASPTVLRVRSAPFQTLYTRTGDLVGWVSILGLLALVSVAGLRGRSREKRVSPSLDPERLSQ